MPSLVTNNPFDDSFEESARRVATNPFDVDENRHAGAAGAAANHNPFADNDSNISYENNINNPISNPIASSDDDDDMDMTNTNNRNSRSSIHNAGLLSTTGGADNIASATPAAEASWQYLGDLPYRRVPIYSNVQWHRASSSSSNSSTKQNPAENKLFRHCGLASFPPSALKHHPSLLSPREVRQLLHTTTTTKVAGCPAGGPIAAMTLPLVTTSKSKGGETTTSSSSSASSFHRTELRILTNSGKALASVDFPPPDLEKKYTASDVLTIGFTSRTALVIVLKDSLCLTYNLKGERLLHPFYILPRGNNNTKSTINQQQQTSVAAAAAAVGLDLMQAVVYEGGVAVLATNKSCAIVELLDEHDNTDYLQTAHVSARRIGATATTGNNNDVFGTTSSSGYTFLDSSSNTGDVSSSTTTTRITMSAAATSPHYALVTPLPTAAYASQHYCSYLCLAVLPRSRTSSRHPEVFLSTNDNSVIVVNASTCEVTDVNCRARMSAPIVEMCFAPNGRFLACFTESSMLTVISTSFETKVLDFDTSQGSSSLPDTMHWCGEDSVLLHWKKLGVLMVGPYGDWLRFPYEGAEQLYLIPEMDCCRVLTDTSVELLQRVPPATALLLRIGSIETSAMLLDAADAFYSGKSAASAASDEAVRAICKTGMLAEAIETCTDAAAREFDLAMQKRLLRAASYGMHFSYKNAMDEDKLVLGGPTVTGSEPGSGLLPSTTTVKFVNAAKKLRVLNALRNPKVGFVVTAAEYDAITPAGVVARLVEMKRPALATAISKYLNLPKSVQLFARASKAAALVETADAGHSDSEIAEAAIRIINEDSSSSNGTTTAASSARKKLTASSISRGGYATVAMAASKAGRTGVANLLLMLESSVADKVPALISTGSYADAIAVATGARDADFIFSTLMEYEKACMALASATDVSKAQSTFLGTVVSKFTPEAFHTLRRYLMTMTDIKSVTNLLLRAQKFTDAGAAMALRALGESDLREKQGILSEASRVFGLGKETALYKSCTDDYLELLKDQEVLRTKYASSEVAPEGSSVTGTIAGVIHFAAANMREQHRLLSDADKVAKKFRVSEKRLWHIKVKAFADSDQWSNLRILADSKTKSPIGYKPFARAAIKGKQNVNEVMKYIDRVTVPEEKYDLFCEASLWKNALEEAAKLRDTRRILNVKTLCNSSELQLLADQLMARMA